MLSVKEFWAELDAENEAKIKEKLLSGAYGQDKKPLVEEWLRKKGEERETALRFLELAKERFKDYRNSGIAFSLTIISISSALIVWAYQLLLAGKTDLNLGEKWFLTIQVIILTIAIGFALSGQYFNYLGYKHEARSLFGQSTQNKANQWFGKEDKMMCWVIRFFIIGVTMAATVFLRITI